MGKHPAIEVEPTAVWASVHEGGMQLELWCTLQQSQVHIGTFLAKERTEEIFLELHRAGQCLRIPVRALEDAIAAAKTKVHSESWYDRAGGTRDGS
jgi:hypothetical protein